MSTGLLAASSGLASKVALKTKSALKDMGPAEQDNTSNKVDKPFTRRARCSAAVKAFAKIAAN